jgi:hypothetical protein
MNPALLRRPAEATDKLLGPETDLEIPDQFFAFSVGNFSEEEVAINRRRTEG